MNREVRLVGQTNYVSFVSRHAYTWKRGRGTLQFDMPNEAQSVGTIGRYLHFCEKKMQLGKNIAGSNLQA